MDVLTGLAKFFELLNANSGGLTFLITVVYVIATIAICKANIQSANASKKQLEEMQKQYAEENRPHIEVEFLLERRSFYGLRFINHGKSTAQNVEIQLSDAFIDSLGSSTRQIFISCHSVVFFSSISFSILYCLTQCKHFYISGSTI